MKKPIISVVLTVGMLAIVALARASDTTTKIGPKEAIQRLTDGNARYVQGANTHPHEDSARRLETAANGQHPYVTILSCSDSRVPLEVLFDQGIGDIFVVRVAGNVCGQSEMGSIEYGVDHVGTPLLVVLGHTGCGAVKAATAHAEVHGNVKALVARIAPALAEAQAAHPDLHDMDLVPAVTEANVWHSIEDLFTNSHITRDCIESGKLKVIGAIYDIKTGQVKWLGEHPRQKALLTETK